MLLTLINIFEYLSSFHICFFNSWKKGREKKYYYYCFSLYQKEYNEINDSSSLKNKIINGDRPIFPESVPQNMQNLLSRCWSEKPEDRPRFKEIYSILSGDLKYSFEEIDENEIQKYIGMIENSKKEQNCINEKNSIEEQIKDLKSTMFLCFFKNKIINEKDVLISYFSEQAAIPATNKDLLNEIGDDIINSKFISYFIKDYSTALYSYEKAAQLGSTKAYEGLGNIYFYGYGVQKDYSKALHYYEKTYRNGNLNVCKKLGDIYQHGYGVDKKAKKANEYYKTSTKSKIKIGIYDLFIYAFIFFLIFIIIMDYYKITDFTFLKKFFF